MSNGQKPAKTFKSFGIEVAVWQKDKYKFSVTIRKTYRPDGSEDYKETGTYFPEELPRLRMLLSEAYKWIYLKRTD